MQVGSWVLLTLLAYEVQSQGFWEKNKFDLDMAKLQEKSQYNSWTAAILKLLQEIPLFFTCKRTSAMHSRSTVPKMKNLQLIFGKKMKWGADQHLFQVLISNMPALTAYCTLKVWPFLSVFFQSLTVRLFYSYKYTFCILYNSISCLDIGGILN